MHHVYKIEGQLENHARLIFHAWDKPAAVEELAELGFHITQELFMMERLC